MRNHSDRRKTPALLPRRPVRTHRLGSHIEPLEQRMLLAGDLLVSVYDSTAGQSVLRYDDSFQPVSGGVATNTQGLTSPQGLVVAPDGTFYVSSLTTAQVLHFSRDGSFLDVLGANDGTHLALSTPSALAFGPNGHLYVADLLQTKIFQFDTTSTTQQYLVGQDTSLGFLPSGFTFDAVTDELIVGGFLTQNVVRINSQGAQTTLIPFNSGINPSGIISLPNGDLLISDFDLGSEPFQHHQIVKYDAALGTTSQFIDLTFPVGTGDKDGYPPQPTVMKIDSDGNLLVGLSPDHNLNGAIQKYNLTTGAYIETLISGIGTPTGLGFLPATSVVGRNIFYNQSKFDGNSAAVNAADDGAIATDKSAYFAGTGIAPTSSITSYQKGINGIMVDVMNPAGTITAADFSFKVGASNDPGSWLSAPAPANVIVRPGAGVGGSDRVEIVWANSVIKNTWLEVTVKGNDAAGGFDTNTGLATSDVFYFGNRIGDTFLLGSPVAAVTNATDEIQVRVNGGNFVPLTNVYDFNRDSLVNATDQIIVRSNGGTLIRINIGLPSSAPLADPANATDTSSAVAFALAASSSPRAVALAGAAYGDVQQPPPSSEYRARTERYFELLAANGPEHFSSDADGFDPLFADEEVDSLLASL